MEDIICNVNAHIVVLGPKASGKTSLIKTIMGGSIDEKQKTTVGIEVHHIQQKYEGLHIQYVLYDSKVDYQQDGFSVFDYIEQFELQKSRSNQNEQTLVGAFIVDSKSEILDLRQMQKVLSYTIDKKKVDESLVLHFRNKNDIVNTNQQYTLSLKVQAETQKARRLPLEGSAKNNTNIQILMQMMSKQIFSFCRKNGLLVVKSRLQQSPTSKLKQHVKSSTNNSERSSPMIKVKK